jgi:hypothetical protein
MRSLRFIGLSLLVLGTAVGPAAASSKVDAALGTTMTLLMIGFIIWVIGSMFSYHRYDAGGPKGGPIAKH